MKASTGYVFKQGKRWIARLTFTTPEGKRKNLTRNADTKTEASEALDHLRRTLKDYGQKPLDGEKLTVKYLCDKYVEAKIKPAEYHQERKVAGRRSWRAPLGYVKTIKASFGHRKIKSLTPSDLEAFKLARLKAPTIRGTERSITSVNRELETMRSMFVFAKHQGWLLISPFEQSSGLISKADEKRRDRHLTMTDEAGLMAACTGQRSHLKPIIICALDTAMRRGEIIKLKWRDVDFENKSVTVTAMNSKTSKERRVGLTKRLLAELEKLRAVAPDDPDVLVFGINDNFKNAWASALKAAGLIDLHFHDLRHVCITRWVASGMPIAEIMKLSGHSTLTAFSIYVDHTPQITRRGAQALDEWHEQNTLETDLKYVN